MPPWLSTATVFVGEESWRVSVVGFMYILIDCNYGNKEVSDPFRAGAYKPNLTSLHPLSLFFLI